MSFKVTFVSVQGCQDLAIPRSLQVGHDWGEPMVGTLITPPREEAGVAAAAAHSLTTLGVTTPA